MSDESEAGLMAGGALELFAAEGSNVTEVAAALDTLFSAQRLTLVPPVSDRGSSEIALRVLGERVAPGSFAGTLYAVASFEGDGVQSEYEAFFAVAGRTPIAIIDLSDISPDQPSTDRLVVLYADEASNPACGEFPAQVVIVRSTGVIAAGSAGPVEVRDCAGQWVAFGDAVNMGTVASTANEPCYGLMDRGDNTVAFLPNCQGAP